MQVDVAVLLIDDRVDGDRGLARLAVADDQLALAAADGRHGVDGLDAGLERLADRLALDDARRLELDAAPLAAFDRALAVDRLAERIHHAPEQPPPDRHLEDAPRALDGVALGDVAVVAHDDGADRVALEVQRKPVGVARELDHLALHHVGQAVDAGDAVGEGDDRSLRARLDAHVEALDLLLDEVADFRRGELHDRIPACLP